MLFHLRSSKYRKAAKEALDWLKRTSPGGRVESPEQIIMRGEYLEEMIRTRGWQEFLEPKLADYVNGHLEQLIHCKPKEIEAHRQAVMSARAIQKYINGAIAAGRQIRQDLAITSDILEEDF
jgi:ribosomal protein L22